MLVQLLTRIESITKLSYIYLLYLPLVGEQMFSIRDCPIDRGSQIPFNALTRKSYHLPIKCRGSPFSSTILGPGVANQGLNLVPWVFQLGRQGLTRLSQMNYYPKYLAIRNLLPRYVLCGARS